MYSHVTHKRIQRNPNGHRNSDKKDQVNLSDEQAKILKDHDLGFNDLMISMKDDRCMMLIHNSVSTEHPSDDLKLAWKKIKKRIKKLEKKKL